MVKKQTPEKAERPPGDIDPDELAELAECGCTVGEVAAWYGLTVAEARARLKQPTLRDVWSRGKRRGRAKLRKAQFKLADKSVTMAIHLGRHLLGQKDPADEWEGVTLILDTGIYRERAPQD